ncbi:hypothetical protein KIL84_003932 [Mauremys mutica]|uniref:Uncharacterized protein n=1 Tax=Mauremys mutica TaxID=74926 RepID=A0A9D4AS06_9SAUR|nr:hypothetical protein KIL84_003932 [Mauremys mutica]
MLRPPTPNSCTLDGTAAAVGRGISLTSVKPPEAPRTWRDSVAATLAQAGAGRKDTGAAVQGPPPPLGVGARTGQQGQGVGKWKGGAEGKRGPWAGQGAQREEDREEDLGKGGSL